MRDIVCGVVLRSVSIPLFTISLAVSSLDQVAAAPMPPPTAIQATTTSSVIEVRAAARGGRAVVGPRGGAVVHRGGAVVGPRGAAYRGRTIAVGPRGNVAVRSTTAVAVAADGRVPDGIAGPQVAPSRRVPRSAS